MTAGAKPLHVLVVDDSAVVRQALTAILAGAGLEVTTAPDPIIASERLRSFTPDVMVLDLEMPRMDGLSFLRKVMREKPLPVVICSAEAGRGTEKALTALAHGAVDIVAKPRIGVRDFLYETAVTLGDVVRAAASARIPGARRAAAPERRPMKPSERRSATPSARAIAIGASTGGTDALRTVLSGLDRHDDGVVIVQHMPRHFTRAFARSLDGECRIDVREAEDGEVLTSGTALLAPGDRHLTADTWSRSRMAPWSRGTGRASTCCSSPSRTRRVRTRQA
jgi:two-component system chemotaxis response regulator CheB